VSEHDWLLALDTATSTIVVAAGSPDGAVLQADAFEGRYRHSQELLPAIVRLLERAGLRLPELRGVIVGTGPGAFTGLRVGLATAKTLAHELRRPVVGIPTSEALLAGVEGATRLWLPSGPRDRLRIDAGEAPRLIPGDAAGVGDAAGTIDAAGAGDADPGDAGAVEGTEIAVDLDGRASAEALGRGREAIAALPASLLRLGLARLAAGDADDPEQLVPAYAVPPRGAPTTRADEGVAWSRDPR
jgi:tRNA threonylcarbamoyl adenosine modification protein YeaZ